MLQPPLPGNETERLASLHALGILDSAPEMQFDQLTAFAARLFEVPIVLVSLVDADRQWFKSCVGLDATQTGRDISFSGHAILGVAVFEVPDAAADERFADNPLVTGAPHIRFYAGQPLILANGQAVGTLCLIDRQPRRLSEAQRGLLADLAPMVVSELERAAAVEQRQCLQRSDAERQSALDDLEAANRRMRVIFNGVKAGIVTIDPGGTVEEVNAAAVRLFGYPAEAMVGQNVAMLMPEPFRSEHDGYLAAYQASGIRHIIGQSREVRGRHHDGTTVPLELSVVETSGTDGQRFIGVMRDLTEVRRLQSDLDQFFNLSLDLLCIANNEGYFIRVSPAFQETLGHTTDTLMARPFLDFVHPDDVAATLAEIENLRQGLVTVDFVNRYRCADGSYRWLSWKVAPEPSLGLLYATARDTTEARAMSESLQEALAEAEAATGAKSEFLAKMSHELRTPLNSVIGFAEMLEDEIVGPLTGEQRDFVQTIGRNGTHLLQLINEILDLSKIEAGMVTLQPEILDLSACCREVGDSLLPMASRKRIALHLPPADETVMVTADPLRIKQVFTNLLSNAIKFTPDGGHVDVQVASTGDRAVVSIHDTGIGIAEEDLARVFDEFFQIEGAYARTQEGTGLGLPLARRLVEMHGGRLTAQSGSGTGSTFSFWLPVHEAARTDFGTKGPLVLIVDDDADTRKLLAGIIAPLGLAIAVAKDGEQALELVALTAPTLVLLDLAMPTLDGWGVLARLDPAVPVVVLTSADLNPAQEQYLHTRTVAVMQKGTFGRKALTEILLRLCGRVLPAG